MESYQRHLVSAGDSLRVVTGADGSSQPFAWSIVELTLPGGAARPWWVCPGRARFTHEAGAQIVVPAYYDGDGARVRFCLPTGGRWTWETVSDDVAANGLRGAVTVSEPDRAALRQNPNLRGHLRSSANGRTFVHADGTPCFMLGDTLWAANTARCGLGTEDDGPFFTYLTDRRAKGFNVVLTQFMRGFGDSKAEPHGQRNEGGPPFEDGDLERLNPDFMRAMDARMDALWRAGFVVAAHPTWFGKRGEGFFDRTWACRLVAYLGARYGAYNILWSLSGEYQYAMRDCGWTGADFDAIGDALRERDAYGHPASIHPSGRVDWAAPHDTQSSRPFHESSWLDHHWLQTGQRTDCLHHIPRRLAEHRALAPIRPVFLAEAFYERSVEVDGDAAYHARWQAWTAFLSGAAGYGYGAFGLWQFLDPDDPMGETGKAVPGAVPWQEAIAFPGGSQIRHVRGALTRFRWWDLAPAHDHVEVDGRPNAEPSATDISPPRCADIPGSLYVVYVPRRNMGRRLDLSHLDGGSYEAVWIDPRRGDTIAVCAAPEGVDTWTLPPRPGLGDEDWVMILHARR